MIDFGLLASVYGVIFVAELPDKTALASLVLATRYRAFAVFLGSALALTVQSLVAVSAGQLFSLLPARPVHVVTGIIFIVSAVFMWRRNTNDEDDEEGEGNARQSASFFGQLRNTFLVVFIAEWGDLTQIGTAALAARYRAPVSVFLGATAALWTVVALMTFLGNRLSDWLKPEVMKKVAAVVFAVVGVALIAGAAMRK